MTKPASESKRDNARSVWESYVVAHYRAGLIRVRGALVPNAQSAVFATLGWIICYELLNDPYPIFAPIVTFICMGFSRNRGVQKVVEIAIGAAAGVLLGGLVAHYFGFGWAQLLFLLLVTPLIGRMIHRSEFVTFQTAINAIVVASMFSMGATTSPYGPWDRLLNALVGGGVAILAVIIIPNNVVSRPRRYTSFVLQELAGTIRKLSTGLLKGDRRAVSQLYGRLKAIRELMNDGRRALASAQETAAVSPQARAARPELAELDRLLSLTERMHVTLAMLQRQARSMITEVGPMPDIAAPLWQIADLLDKVAKGVQDWQRPTDARDAAIALASHLEPAEVVQDNEWRTTVLLSMTRAITVDLLQITGLSQPQARAALADTGDFDPEHAEVDTDVDLPSVLWGTEQLPAVDAQTQRTTAADVAAEVEKAEQAEKEVTDGGEPEVKDNPKKD